MGKIYDLTSVSYDLDLFEVRLNTLWDVIDTFIVVESSNSHTNKPKELELLNNFSRFEKYKEKIIYCTAVFKYENPFVNDWVFRNFLFSKIPNPSDQDVVHHSDNDEISRPEILKEVFKNLKTPISFKTDYSFLCVDLYGRESTDAIIMKYGWINTDLYKFRDNRTNFHINNYFTYIEHAGWHFSNCFGIENMLKKFQYFAHSSEIAPYVKNREYLINCIKQKKGIEIDSKPGTLKQIEINEQNLPVYLVKNKEKFAPLFSDYYNIM